MAERELDLVKAPERNLQHTAVLAERLVNAHLGRTHIDEAISVLRGGNFKFSHNIEEVVGVAQAMASAGISPAPTLEVLQFLRDGKEDNGHVGRAASEGMAKIYALMGDYEVVERSFPESNFPTDVYFFAARTQVSRGEDPTRMLQAAEAEVTTRVYDIEEGRSISADQFFYFGSMGSIYAQAGLVDEARRTFTVAEGIVDKDRDKYNEAYALAKRTGKDDGDAKELGWDASDLIGQDSFYDSLARTFAQIGWYEDALRVADKADKLTEYGSHHSVVGEIVDHQFQHGLADDAVETARKIGGLTYVKTLARKAVIDAEQGKPYEETILEVERMIEGHGFDKDYVMVRATLGVATAKAGDLDATKTHFDKAWEVVQQEDEPLFKPSPIIVVAKAVDDAGFDASRLFGQAMDASEAIPDDEDINDIKWDTWAEAITELADRGYLDSAREGFSRYSKSDGMRDRGKAALLAHLGIAEIRSGLSNVELQALPQSDIQKILAGDNEQAQQAVTSLGLAA